MKKMMLAMVAGAILLAGGTTQAAVPDCAGIGGQAGCRYLAREQYDCPREDCPRYDAGEGRHHHGYGRGEGHGRGCRS